MAFAKVIAAQTKGVGAHLVEVEIDTARGLNAFSIVGLPDKAVEEARDRVSAAIKNSGFTSPKHSNIKTTVSLAPAHLKKSGALFDLPIALAYLNATEQTAIDVEKKLFVGELSLDGSVRPIFGALPIALEAKRRGIEELYLPQYNAREAALVDGITIFGVATLTEAIAHLLPHDTKSINPEKPLAIKDEGGGHIPEIDFSHIRGQENAKRGLEIAAAGGHNIILYGPPGTGKTMLAQALCGILPPLNEQEIIETTCIHSVAGTLPESSVVITPPFRAPHHSASHTSLIGGGSIPKPGEITLAHNGVLFMDEFPEFERKTLEMLRQPLEDGVVRITRTHGSEQFPANFILVAAMNPCPCGNYGTEKECVCTPSARIKYHNKISGPIADRIDMWVEVPSIENSKLLSREEVGEPSQAVRERVIRARNIQRKRYAHTRTKTGKNGDAHSQDIEKLFHISSKALEILNTASSRMNLSPRAYYKVVKVAQTIADLETSDTVDEAHILEALQYRPRQEH